MDLVGKEFESRARWKELEDVLPVFPDLLEGELQRLLGVLVEFFPVEWAGDRDHDVLGRFLLRFLNNFRNKVVQHQRDASLRLSWS